MSIFSDNIKFLRAKKSLTQHQLADALIITRDRLAAYESGRNEAPFEILDRISRYFNKSIDVLIKVKLPLDEEPFGYHFNGKFYKKLDYPKGRTMSADNQPLPLYTRLKTLV